MLQRGQLVTNETNGTRYRAGRRLGAGGFGAAYAVTQTAGRRWPGKLCLKVTTEINSWHREAYFGHLLKGQERAVRVHDSFAFIPAKATRRPLYCLITELAENGNLFEFIEHPWPEARARREIADLLRLVEFIHEVGVVHRDITPLNIFVTADRKLKLGDFGIAVQQLGRKRIPSDFFNAWFAPTEIADGDRLSWAPSHDVYQLGRVLGAMLLGDAAAPLKTKDVKLLKCSSEMKAVLQRCIGEPRKRYQDASAMLYALQNIDEKRARRRVRSLNGMTVVITGPLSRPRRELRSLIKRAGGIVAEAVGSKTDVVLHGDRSPQWKADDKGQKLLDVDRERELGHHIDVINEVEFFRLIRG